MVYPGILVMLIEMQAFGVSVRFSVQIYLDCGEKEGGKNCKLKVVRHATVWIFGVSWKMCF